MSQVVAVDMFHVQFRECLCLVPDRKAFLPTDGEGSSRIHDLLASGFVAEEKTNMELMLCFCMICA